MENPFVYGRIVTGKHFVDREGEIRELKSDLLSGQHVILYSPRKMGKSSLIEEIFRRMGNRAVCVRINVQNASTKEGLARLIINEIVRKSYTSLEKLAREVREFFSRISVRAFVDGEGRVGVEPVFREKRELLEEALELPERMGGRRKLIVAFDEFQEVERLDGIEMERMMRAVMEKHRKVTYLFSGSERHLISLIFENRERPFYRFGKMMRLGPIGREELEEFVVGRFRETGRKIEEEAVDFILDFSEGVPFYVQALCHEAWNIGGDVDTVKVRRAMENLISSFGSGYDLIWRSIKSEYQRRLLVAMAVEDRSFAPKMELIEKYGLKTAAHLKKAVDALQEKGLIYQNRIEDFLFREWIKLNKVA